MAFGQRASSVISTAGQFPNWMPFVCHRLLSENDALCDFSNGRNDESSTVKVDAKWTSFDKPHWPAFPECAQALMEGIRRTLESLNSAALHSFERNDTDEAVDIVVFADESSWLEYSHNHLQTQQLSVGCDSLCNSRALYDLIVLRSTMGKKKTSS